MITGNVSSIDNIIDLSEFEITFSSKPIIHGGAAMEYYGLRKRGSDIDFIISNSDYKKLVSIYLNCKKDMWGDLGLLIGKYELFRSVYRFDYDFFSDGAYEHENFKVISFEKLFLLKALSFKDNPDVVKLTNDFQLMVKYYYDVFRNKDYVDNASKHLDSYLSAINGVIYNDNY